MKENMYNKESVLKKFKRYTQYSNYRDTYLAIFQIVARAMEVAFKLELFMIEKVDKITVDVSLYQHSNQR